MVGLNYWYGFEYLQKCMCSGVRNETSDTGYKIQASNEKLISLVAARSRNLYCSGMNG